MTADRGCDPTTGAPTIQGIRSAARIRKIKKWNKPKYQERFDIARTVAISWE